jgi:bifunctional non-homologous end joining protein LigD
VPFAPSARFGWEPFKAWARGLAEAVEADDPKRFTTNMRKAVRAGKIFVDYLRNGRGATAICPWSARARPGAPLAMPLRWDELRPGLTADRFTLGDAAARLAATRRRDPWEGYRDAARQQLATRALRGPSADR